MTISSFPSPSSLRERSTGFPSSLAKYAAFARPGPIAVFTKSRMVVPFAVSFELPSGSVTFTRSGMAGGFLRPGF